MCSLSDVMTEIMFGNVAKKLFSSKLTTIIGGYHLTFQQLSGNIVTLKGVSHYNLLENNFLATFPNIISGNTGNLIPPLGCVICAMKVDQMERLYK